MSLAVVYSRASVAMDAPLVTIEVHLANGLPAFNLSGLPEASVREARERVRSALINSGFEFPSRRITVNLAPADLPKEGGRFDLAIAIGIIAASGQIPANALQQVELLGELALSGEIRPVKAVLPFSLACSAAKRQAIIPVSNAAEASLISDAQLLPASQLTEVYHHLIGQQALEYVVPQPAQADESNVPDLSDVVGQWQAKRVLEIAAAGRHNLLFFGSPGTGKTMLAQRLIGLLPPMSEAEALQTAAVYSVSGHGVDLQSWQKRPFRQPHHTASAVALVGGGSIPRPGEISLAHNGVLFLDELPEFERKVLDVLREPLESGEVSISRAAHQAKFPANFQLVAALNPSPTGSIGDGRSSIEQNLRYLNKVSGPLLDRIDLQIEVGQIPAQHMQQAQRQPGEASQVVRQRVLQAHQRQIARAGCNNAQLSVKQLNSHCALQPGDQQFISQAVDKLGLSLRVYHKLLKVARTLADLQGVEQIERAHLAEALNYRSFDRLLGQLTGR